MPTDSRIVALDVGGANIKAADGRGYASSHAFALWREPARLPEVLGRVLDTAPAADRVAATMTGELADCFETKTEGVAAIVKALCQAAGTRSVHIYLTDGSFVPPDEAIARPLAAAASNWHALATFAARYVSGAAGFSLDVGSTTCDLIPLFGGRAAATGCTDLERLASGELLYTGVVRSPLCAVASTLPWRNVQCPTAHELFATTLDAYLTLGELAEDPECRNTADGRPATRACARGRLARTICADRDVFSDDDAQRVAEAVRTAQAAKLGIAFRGVLGRMPEKPATVVISGQGEFLARHVLARMRLEARVVSLAEQLGPAISRAAAAHALAVLYAAVQDS